MVLLVGTSNASGAGSVVSLLTVNNNKKHTQTIDLQSHSSIEICTTVDKMRHEIGTLAECIRWGMEPAQVDRCVAVVPDFFSVLQVDTSFTHDHIASHQHLAS